MTDETRLVPIPVQKDFYVLEWVVTCRNLSSILTPTSHNKVQMHIYKFTVLPTKLLSIQWQQNQTTYSETNQTNNSVLFLVSKDSVTYVTYFMFANT